MNSNFLSRAVILHDKRPKIIPSQPKYPTLCVVWYTVFLEGLNVTHACPPCILFGNHFLVWGSTLRYDLIDSDHIAFMFNGGTFPDLSVHPIDTNICMRHLRHKVIP